MLYIITYEGAGLNMWQPLNPDLLSGKEKRWWKAFSKARAPTHGSWSIRKRIKKQEKCIGQGKEKQGKDISEAHPGPCQED